MDIFSSLPGAVAEDKGNSLERAFGKMVVQKNSLQKQSCLCIDLEVKE